MINTQVDKQVLRIQIDNPSKKNALQPVMYEDMAIAIENAPAQDVKVILIEGSHGIFTSGNDVSQFGKSGKTPNGKSSNEVNETYRFMLALHHCTLPVVAKVEGLAIGIGTTMLLHCDFVLAHQDTKFAMPFINLALVPEYASSYIIPRNCGHLLAAELLMLGDVFNAEKAKEAGIISSIHGDDLDASLEKLITGLASKPSQALQQTKALLKNDNAAVKAHIDTEIKLFVEAMQSEAAQEAFSAFIEKRPLDRNKYK